MTERKNVLFIKQSKFVFFIIQIVLSAAILVSCHHKKEEYSFNGFDLTRIKFDSSLLDSVTCDYIKRMELWRRDANKYAATVELLAFPDTLASLGRYGSDTMLAYSRRNVFLAYSYHEKEKITNFFFFKETQKIIIGCCNYGKTDVFVLTNISDENIFDFLFGHMLHRTNMRRIFHYIKYPESQITFSLYEPLYLSYKITDGHLVDSLLTNNVYTAWRDMDDK